VICRHTHQNQNQGHTNARSANRLSQSVVPLSSDWSTRISPFVPATFSALMYCTIGMSIKNLLGANGGRRVRLTIPPSSLSRSSRKCEAYISQSNLRAHISSYRNNVTFYVLLYVCTFLCNTCIIF
jgi:hypothetical protein